MICTVRSVRIWNLGPRRMGVDILAERHELSDNTYLSTAHHKLPIYTSYTDTQGTEVIEIDNKI